MLSLENIHKRFPGVQALNGVDLSVSVGSCHGLVGENGAGKSTLGKIIGGLYAPDRGEIRLDGRPVTFRSPGEALRSGIALVHQELLFCENLSVAENLCLADPPRRGPWVDTARMLERAEERLRAIGAQLDPARTLGELTVGKQQLVQIAAAVGSGARLIVFDEPTSSLSRTEVDSLLDTIRGLLQREISCVYVSHRLEEIFAICDTVTVLRDGERVISEPIAALDRARLVSLMIGRPVADESFIPTRAPGDALLQVQDLCSPGKFHGVSLDVRAGEIVGLAGLMGAGRTELLEAIFGLDPDATGTVTVRGERAATEPGGRIRQGLGLVPEDRKRHGLVLGMSARENITLPSLDEIATGGWVNAAQEIVLATEQCKQLGVRTPSIEAVAGGLSGGNQQKLVVARWLASGVAILLVDEPTRGVDVGAKAEIHRMLSELAEQGAAILLASSELPELLALCTRILVLREGRLVATLPGNCTEAEVMREMALGTVT
jgi:ABC-type sugar transport system ATPase subunit